MRRKEKILGFWIISIFLLISIISLVIPCRPQYFAGGFFGVGCMNQTLFLIINLPGVILIGLAGQASKIIGSIPLSFLTMLLSSIFYFFLVVFIRYLTRGGKK